MINKLHTLIKDFIIKIIVIIIILSIIFTSIAKYIIKKPNNEIAHVNGVVINKTQLQKVFEQDNQILKEQLNKKFIKNNIKKQNIQVSKHQALEHLINITLIDQYAKQLGLTVTDDEIKQVIYNMPIFKVHGLFNNKKYKTILFQNNINSEDFAENIRQNLINNQIIKTYIIDEFALPNEIKLYAKLFLQQRKIKIMTIPISNYKSKQKVTNKELKNFYNTHKKFFTLPEQLKISYIKLDIISQYKNIKITNEEIKKYYKKNINNFTYPEQKHYSMIQLATKKEAYSVLKQLYNGVDFKILVSKKSTDKFSIKNHGSLGWIEKSFTPNEIIIAKLTQLGQISKIIKSSNNYIIFRLDGIKDKTTQPLKLVKNEIKNIIKNIKANNKFCYLKQIASKAVINKKESFKNIEKVIGVKSITTNWFNYNSIPKEIKFNKILDIIFSNKLLNKNNLIGINSNIININNNCSFIVNVNKYRPKLIQSFNKVKNKVFELVKTNKAIKKMNLDSNKIINLLKHGINNTFIKNNIIFNNKFKIINRFDLDNPLTEKIFQMPIPKGNTYTYFSTKDINNNLLIIQLIKIIENKPTKYELNIFFKNYKKIMGYIMMEILISNLRNNAKIILNII